MRILFDENLNARLARGLPGHDIATIRALGWAGFTNGVLLRRAVEAGFDVFVTRDSNLSYQQNLSAYAIAVIVLRPRSNRLNEAMLLMPEVLRALSIAKKGERITVGP